jgi:hypothetical protein
LFWFFGLLLLQYKCIISISCNPKEIMLRRSTEINLTKLNFEKFTPFSFFEALFPLLCCWYVWY